MSSDRAIQGGAQPNLLSGSTREDGGSRILTALGLLWLWLCNMLFLTGWYQPWISLPLSAALLFVILWQVGSLTQAKPWVPGGADWCRIILAALAILAYLVIMGLIGFFPSPVDFIQFRQALYENLSHAPWPLILPSGKEMTYYIAGMLPATMLERLIPEQLTQIPALICTFIPIFIAVLLFARRWKKLPFLFILLLIALHDPLRVLFTPYTGGPCLTQWLYQLYDTTGIDINILSTIYGNKTFELGLRNCVWQYNSQPPALLATALILHAGKQRSLYPLIIALLFPCSPLGALALMPLASWLYLRTARGVMSLLLPCILPVLHVATCALYFFRANEGPTVINLTFNLYGSAFWVAYARYLLAVALLFLPLWSMRKRDEVYLVLLITALLAPILFVGTPRSAGFIGLNEFVLKGSIVYTTALATMWTEDWPGIARSIRLIMLPWMVFITLGYFYPAFRDFDTNHRIPDPWNGHLNHDHPFLRQSIPGVKKGFWTPLFLHHSGEAEQHFPGCIMPKAPGCDYSRPYRPDSRCRVL